MGHVDVNGVGYVLPDGRPLLSDVSFRVGDGNVVALVGANGTGKTTLLRLIAGDIEPTDGSVARSGGLGVMRQFVQRMTQAERSGAEETATRGSARASDAYGTGEAPTVRDLLLSVAQPGIRRAAKDVDAAELALMERDDEAAQLSYAQALADWSDAGGYQAEVLWDTCTVAALGMPYNKAQWRDLATLSGGEQKRLALEALLRGPEQVLLLDEPDNFLDVPGKRWLEDRLLETTKTVLFVSHDRELLARVTNRIVTVEGGSTWVHGSGFASYHQARRERHARLDELRRRWDEEHEKLRELVRNLKQKAMYNDGMASRYQAAQTRLRKFEEAGPPDEAPREQDVRMRLRGGRTGVRAVTCISLELTGLMRPFDVEVFFGERVGVLGSNGSGKSHFLRLLAGDGAVAHTGIAKLGARVVPGHFVQSQEHADLAGRSLREILWEEHALDRGAAMGALRRYELQFQSEQDYDTLSGGQQARFQILRLELSGTTLLLLDEPTDNLDLDSAEALEDALEAFEGTVIAATHDRWFARAFDRFLVFGGDGAVYQSAEPVWDEARVARAR